MAKNGGGSDTVAAEGNNGAQVASFNASEVIKNFLAVAATGLGILGFVTAAGGVVMFERFSAAGPPAEHGTAVVPRDDLLVVGAHALAPWWSWSSARSFCCGKHSLGSRRPAPGGRLAPTLGRVNPTPGTVQLTPGTVSQVDPIGACLERSPALWQRSRWSGLASFTRAAQRRAGFTLSSLPSRVTAELK